MFRFGAAITLLISALLWLSGSTFAKEPRIKNSEATNKPKYLALIAQNARKSYFPLPEFAACKSSVRFQIDCQGTVSGIEVQEHPYDWKTHATAPLADSALSYSVKNLHLPPPPQDVGCPVRVRLVFDGRASGPATVLARFIGTGASNGKSQKAAEKLGPHTSP
jgi:hypothetical protein